MIRAFNKHYKKAIDMIEHSTSSEKMELAEKVLDWFKDLPEEYVISLAFFFNEVIDDLGDDSLEKIDFKVSRKRKGKEDEEEEDDEYEEDEEDEDEEDYDKDDEEEDY